MRNHSTHLSRRGFSLLELTVVLGIISLIAGAGMTMASGALNAADRITTQERLNTIRMALESHGKTYGYLPCPAARDLTTTSANFGIEARNATTAYSLPSTTCASTGAPVGFTGVALVSNTLFGAVPVRTLGLPDSYAADAWGNKLTYAVSYTGGLTGDPMRYANNGNSISIYYGVPSGTNYNQNSQRNSASYTAAASNGASPALARLTFASTGSLANGVIVTINGTIYKGSYTVAGRTATTIDLSNTPDATVATWSANDTGTATWQAAGNEAAYVVVSHGADGRGAYPMEGTAVPATKLCTGVGANTSPPPCTSSGTTTCIDIRNCDESTSGDAIFYDMAFNNGTTAAQYFDDYIVWGSNANFRTAVNNSLYTDATADKCPTGVCELWCAACTANYPAATFGTADTALPSTAGTGISTATNGAVLCKKMLTSNADDCKATCLWSGTNVNGKSTTVAGVAGYQKCP